VRQLSTIEERYRHAAVCQRLAPYFIGTNRRDAVTLLAQRVLIDGNRVLIHQDRQMLWHHLAEVVTGKQRGCEIAQRLI
jgi:hypothetical protein